MFVSTQQPLVRWGIVVFALLIGGFSIVYTNSLVQHLLEREQKQMDLFAKMQAFAVNSNENTSFLVTEFLDANHFIPVILTNEEGEPLSHRNIDIPEDVNANDYLREIIKEMKTQNKPIEINIDKNWKQYIYYENSFIIAQLRYFPIIQLTIIAIFFTLVYLVFTAARRAEQDRVWAGLAKETAHQLGTPLSSLMAWVENMRADEDADHFIAEEIAKDVNRLEMVAARFSNIGSIPTLKTENVIEVVLNIIKYLESRLSKKVKINIFYEENINLDTLLNKALFEWVIENLSKNAVDAMSGMGQITIEMGLAKNNSLIQIDITDTGKGIAPSQLKTVFNAGFTTKKRGWGLGLTLAKRIIENYHKGKIWVLKSEINVGTTFRIWLPKVNESTPK